MSTVTPNIGLFKYDTTSDANSAFNINKALNNNWDIIDEALMNVDALPDQTGKAGYLLTTNGSEASWGETVDVHVIIETFIDGTSWYRVYSDGWCEQGGKITGYSGWQTQAVTFLKPFKDMNYNITACHTRRTGSAYNDYSATGVITPITTGMSLNYYGTDTTGTIWWQVCGYIEE